MTGRQENNVVAIETKTFGKDKYFQDLDKYIWQFTKIQQPVCSNDWEAGEQCSGNTFLNSEKYILKF